ncbi:MAG: hypothetical protein ACRDKL_06320 [Solirubrobacteraceae bacterium]
MGSLRSGGGPAHFAACVVGITLADGALEAHGEVMHTMLRRRRDALAGVLAQALPPEFHGDLPPSGYFLWLRAPAELNLDALEREAAAAGVRCCYRCDRVGPWLGRALRLAFPYHPPNCLVEAAQRLAGAAIRAMRTSRA